MFEFRKEGEGRYAVFLVEPRMRLGLLLGKPGHWCAEDPKGKSLLCFNNRKDGAQALLDARCV